MSMIPKIFYFTATVLEVHDGDTVRLNLDLGFNLFVKEWVRLKGVYAPELSEPRGVLMRDKLREILPVGAVVSVGTEKVNTKTGDLQFRVSFARYIGTITDTLGVDVNKAMVIAIDKPTGRGT